MRPAHTVKPPSSESENRIIKAPSPHSGLSKIDSQSFLEIKPTMARSFQCLIQYFVFIRLITDSNHCQNVKLRFGKLSRLNIFHVTTLCWLNWFPRNNFCPKNDMARSERSNFDLTSFFHFMFKVANTWPHVTLSGTLKGTRVDSANALSHSIEAAALASWFSVRKFLLQLQPVA